MYTHPLYHWPPKGRWCEKPSVSYNWKPFSSYVHFPFCRSICDFCGYETRLISKIPANEFPKNAIDQIRNHATSANFTGAAIRAVFFGGGTASLMPDSGVVQILAALQQCSGSRALIPEVTLECEPGTISRLKLKNVRACGVNRISVCAQSLDDSQLRIIGRRHTNEQSMRLIDDCLQVGIRNVHLDLMYGLPEQSQKDWDDTLRRASQLPISHISTYKLYVFKHGALDRDNTVPRAQYEPDWLTQKMHSMHEASREILGAAGFHQYTLTEFCRDGSQSEYIKNCFDGGDLLPIGPAAFGRCDSEIWENSPYVHLYGTEEGGIQSGRALRLTTLEAFKRDVILGLWLLNVSIDDLATRHGVTIAPELLELCNQLCEKGLLDFSDQKISLADRHRFGAGQVMARLAALEDDKWGALASNPCPRITAERTKPVATSDRAAKLTSIFRMARRDPKFFHALRANPLTVLVGLGFSVGDSDIIDLAKVIGTAEGLENNPTQDELRCAWAAIRREHLLES